MIQKNWKRIVFIRCLSLSLSLSQVSFLFTRIYRGLFLFFLWPLHVAPSRRAELWVESGRVQRGWRDRWMTWRRLEGVVSSFCDTTSSSLSPTTLGNFCLPLFPHPPPSYAISTFVVLLLSSGSAPSLLLLSSGETRSITFPGPPAWHPLYTHSYPRRGPASSTTSSFGYRTNVWSSEWRLSWDRARGSVVSLYEFYFLTEDCQHPKQIVYLWIYVEFGNISNNVNAYEFFKNKLLIE